MSDIAIGIGALLPLTGKVGANLLGHVLQEHIRWIDINIPEIEHPQFSLFFWQQYPHLLHDKASSAFDERNFLSLLSGVVGPRLSPWRCLVLGL